MAPIMIIHGQVCRGDDDDNTENQDEKDDNDDEKNDNNDDQR